MEQREKPSLQQAVVSIQRSWRSHINRKIFEYIKKLLLNKLQR